MIDIRVTGDLEIQARLESVYPGALRAVAEAITKVDVELARYIVFEKLHGQVLNKITGQLADSISLFPVVEAGGTVTGGVYQDQARAMYGPVHEFGKDIYAKSGPMRFMVDDHWVSTMHVRIPARPFMLPSAEEFYPVYEAAVRRYVNERLAVESV